MTVYTSSQPAFKVLVDRLQQRHILRTAIDRAYTTFERNHQQWVDSLFDKYFITQTITTWLSRPETMDTPLTPAVFAAAWAAQLSIQPGRQQELLTKCLPVAVEFLRLLEQELPAVPTFLPILMHNQIDREMAAESPTFIQAGHYV